MSTDIVRVEGHEALQMVKHELQSILTGEGLTTMERALKNSSYVWLCYHDETILCSVLGLIPPSLLSDQAYLWLFSTQAIKKYTLAYVMHSREVIEDMLKLYPVLVGHCETASRSSIRWLRWLGAEFGESQGQLTPFEIRAKS